MLLVNLIIPIQFLSGVGAVITAFFHPGVAYAVVSIPIVFLVFTWLWGKAVPTPEPIPELSEVANAIRRKFRAYYVSPIAGRNCSGAASGIMLSLLPITIIACVKGFWWSLAIAAVLFIITAPLQRAFNPTNFMTSEEEQAHL
jgi:hypothetical protein